MKSKAWIAFEHLVAQIQKSLSPKATVKHNESIMGIDSKAKRQIDITIRENIGQFEMLIAVDCKAHSRPIDLDELSKSISLFDDIRAHQGVVVSASGFTKKALTYGKEKRIKLCTIINCAGNHNWRRIITVPILCEIHKIINCTFAFRGTGRIILPADDKDLYNLNVYSANKTYLGTVKKLFQNWCFNGVPDNFDTGHINNVDFIQEPNTKIHCCDELFDVQIRANLDVEKKLYFYRVPLADCVGFQNEIEGHADISGFSLPPLSVKDIENNWQFYKSEQELPSKIFMRFKISMGPYLDDGSD